ncbi:hypothetical protein PIB30_027164 [Stylosanthes scabra]|uniref:Uncharacterized protein n=1 Tax=Stylosanthes scabra TaxID=79078 RepID=A0ABU6QBX9_9FABA|nr:hypothetical protein [Stylosanthes scabra]
MLVSTNAGPTIRVWANIVIGNDESLIFVAEVSCSSVQMKEVPKDPFDVDENEQALAHKIGDDKSNSKGRRIANDNVDEEEGIYDQDAEPARVIMEEEEEESRVEETQRTQSARDEESKIGPGELGRELDNLVNMVANSPTKTNTLEDDRRTDEKLVDQEAPFPEDDVGPITETNNPSSEEGVNSVDNKQVQSEESNSESISIPPGFECVLPQSDTERGDLRDQERGRKRLKHDRGKQTRKKSLKLCDQLKENARKQKDTRREKRKTQIEIREDGKATTELADGDDEIEDSQLEADKTWCVGRRAGLGEVNEDRVKKYLLLRFQEEAESGRNNNQRRSRGRKKSSKEVGVSENFAVDNTL